MELHDGLAQYLIGLNLYLNQLEISDDYNQFVLEKCKNLMQDSIQQTRSLCYNLTPPELNNGFINALNALFERLNGLNHVTCSLVNAMKLSQENFQQLDAYNVFRIIQEAINNAFGIGLSNCNSLGSVEQKYGKISPVEDAVRKQLLFQLTHEHNIYSLGRFATWRNILLDDVVDDIGAIKKLLKANSAYDVRRAAA
jgi:hypothetical protein